jgi:transposase
MEGVMELITVRERRRRWSPAEKLRIVAESHEPGALIRAVAARHGVCESLLFSWRRQVRDGVLVAPEMPVFMPAQILETRPTMTTLSSAVGSPLIGFDRDRTGQRAPGARRQ